MLKNISIQQISLYLTFLIGSLIAAFVLLVEYGSNYIGVVLFPIIVALIYFLIKYFLESFVFRKIKVIYKIISDSKKVPHDKVIDFEKKTIEEVKEEVVKWAEDTSQEIKYLKSLESYRQNFVGNISHELKTPLFSVQGYLHTLLEGGMYDDKIFKKYLKRAAKNTDRLEAIVQDLEMIGRLEGGDSLIDFEKFDIQILAQEVLEDLQVQAKEYKVKLMFKEGANKSTMVLGDREKIRQVFNNLVTNSIRYSGEGNVTKIGFYDLDKNILIEVSDQGIGIAEEHLKHLFDRFYRVDPSRSRELGGSGLGLSIVKHIIEAHNQNINVRSTVGVGTTFGFTLKKVG